MAAIKASEILSIQGFQNDVDGKHDKKSSINSWKIQNIQWKPCYSIIRKCNLSRHIYKTHNEDKDAYNKTLKEEDMKYDCTKCDLKFISEPLRSYHIKKNHKEKEKKDRNSKGMK